MRLWGKNTGRAALIAAGAVVIGAAFGPGALADTSSSGNASVAGGNQAQAPIKAPVEASGDAAAVLAEAQAQSKGGSTVSGARHGGGGDMTTSGNNSVLGGNQVYAPISIPVNVCGVAVAILGESRAQCEGGASVTSQRGSSGDGWENARHGGDASAQRGNGGDMTTSGNFSVLGGNQVFAPISIPVNVCGVAVAVLGRSQAQCEGGASVQRTSGDGPNMQTSGDNSVLGGNQVYAPISIPVNVCGVAVAVLGEAQAQCKGGASVGQPVEENRPPAVHKPHKKPYKPSKHRPAAGHKKLPSTLRTQQQPSAPTSLPSGARPSNYRMAGPAAAPKGGETDGTPVVQGTLDSVTQAAKVSGVDVQPGQSGAAEETAPVQLGLK